MEEKTTMKTRSSAQPDTTRCESPAGVSVKSDSSMINPVRFTDRKTNRCESPAGVSMKSDSSMINPVRFTDRKTNRCESPAGVSMKSDSSMINPVRFTDRKTNRCESPAGVSMKSDSSMINPVRFTDRKTNRSESPDCVSMKSDGSMYMPPAFAGEKPQRSESPDCVSMKSDGSMYMPPAFAGEKPQRKKRRRSPESETDEHSGKKRSEDPEPEEAGRLWEAKTSLQKATLEKYNVVFEGVGKLGSCDLNSIYTKLFITVGESEAPHEEQSFRHVKQQQQSEPSVALNDILKPAPGQRKHATTVLTKGVAGIGKSFSVQKYVVDWAEGRRNRHVDFIFVLAFRELHLVTGNRSLYELLAEFHPAIRCLKDCEHLVAAKTVVILDGLDESKLQLDFEEQPVRSVSAVTSVSRLLASLVQGQLLPNADLWITSRPAAAYQIPAPFVDTVTEIRGFSDRQKEDYFRKRFSHDLDLAERVISHIQSSPSLDIMCQIPIFCWISATLFQEIFGGGEEAETPQTLTEMMSHYLVVQTKRRNRKYGKKREDKERLLKEDKEFLLKLGRLAFVHLQKNNLIFYEDDLEECGIDIQEAITYSDFWNSILREEEVFSQRKVFFFVHLTIQEFFAAFFVYDCLTNKNTKALGDFLSVTDGEHTSLDLVKMTVDKVLKAENGHLDFFLRFLLGLMVEPNRRVLKGLLASADPNQDTDKKVLTHLRTLRRKTLSPDSCISLIQNMVEMRDHKVKDEIQEFLQSPDYPRTELTPLRCSVLAYMLQVSKDSLEVLDLKSYNTSGEGRRRLIPAVRCSRKAILVDCRVTDEWIQHLAFGLRFPHLPLRKLDLSNNDLMDSGVKLLCEGLSSPFCRLESLRLSGCQVTEVGCAHLASTLQSNNYLQILDLTYNHPGESGVKLLTELAERRLPKLHISLDHGGSYRMRPRLKKYACELTFDPSTAHRNLLLSDGDRKVTFVEIPKYNRGPGPGRFDHWKQVLCGPGLTERCYLELEVTEPFRVGLTYKSISRSGEGDGARLGCSAKSWCLVCRESGCFVQHSNDSFPVSSLCSRGTRLGVYLDWKAGFLIFYRVSSERSRVYTFRAAFSEPLYLAVELDDPASSVALA